MAKTSYCIGDRSKQSEEDLILGKYLKPSSKPKTKYGWDEGKGNDPFTVFDAFARKQKQMQKGIFVYFWKVLLNFRKLNLT